MLLESPYRSLNSAHQFYASKEERNNPKSRTISFPNISRATKANSKSQQYRKAYSSSLRERVHLLLESDLFMEELYTIHARKTAIKFFKLMKNLNLDLENIKTLAINKKNFSQLYDPEYPTLLFSVPNARQESYLFGYASYLSKLFAQKGINIVFCDYGIPGSLQFLKDKSGQNYLEAYSGFIVGPGGNLFYGKFPDAINIDLVDNTHNHHLITESSKRGIELTTSSKHLELSKNKNALNMGLRSLGIRMPESKVINIKTLNQVAKYFKELSSQKNSCGIVIKPNDGSGGNGITLLDKDKDINDLHEAIELAFQYSDSVLMEPWIESLPIHDEDGERLDWNFRVIASPKASFALEARLGPFGKPINKHQGAKIWGFKKNHKKLLEQGIKESDLNMIIESMLKISKEVAKALGSNYIGTDFILDKDLKLWMLEANSGYVGGVYSLSDLGENDEAVMNFARNYINALEIKKRPKCDRSEIIQIKPVNNYQAKNREDFLLDLGALITRFNGNPFVKTGADLRSELLRLLKTQSLEKMDKADISKILFNLCLGFTANISKRAHKQVLELAKKHSNQYLIDHIEYLYEIFHGDFDKAIQLHRNFIEKYLMDKKDQPLDYLQCEELLWLLETSCLNFKHELSLNLYNFLQENAPTDIFNVAKTLISAFYEGRLIKLEANEFLDRINDRNFIFRQSKTIKDITSSMQRQGHLRKNFDRLAFLAKSKSKELLEKLNRRSKQRKQDSRYRNLFQSSRSIIGLDINSAMLLEQST